MTKHLTLTPRAWNKQDVVNCFVCVGTIGDLSFKLSSGRRGTRLNVHVFMLVVHLNEKKEQKRLVGLDSF